MKAYEIPLTRGQVPYTAEEADYEKERLEVLNEHFMKLIKQDIIQSASYCLSRNNKIFSHNTMGFLSYRDDDSRPFLPDSVYGIYSITKLVTSTAILQLVEDGLIRLDQPVGEIINEFNEPPFNQIQIWHLLTHTSGLYCDEGCKPDKYHEDIHEMMEDPKWIDRLLSKGLSNKPGAEWAYSSLGYNVLGEIITQISGIFCHDYINERILKPCDMQETHWLPSAAFKERYSSRFDWSDEMIAHAGEQTELLEEKVPRTWNGLLSTDEDLMKFGLMLLNYGKYNGKHILGRKAVESMMHIHTTPDVKNYCWDANGDEKPFGLSPDVYVPSNRSQLLTPGTINHEGWGTCCLMIDHKEKFVAVWSAQFCGYTWNILPLRNAASIMWSGIL